MEIVAKLKIMADMAQNNEVKALCNVLIDHFRDDGQEEIGFKPATKLPPPRQTRRVRGL